MPQNYENLPAPTSLSDTRHEKEKQQRYDHLLKLGVLYFGLLALLFGTILGFVTKQIETSKAASIVDVNTRTNYLVTLATYQSTFSLVLLFVSILWLLVSQWKNAVHVMDVHSSYIESTHEINVELNKTLSAANQQFGLPYLISWKDSGQCEKAAKNVYCLTQDLLWADNHRDVLISDAAEHADHTYWYIVYELDGQEQVNLRTRVANIKETIKKEAERRCTSEPEIQAMVKELEKRVAIKYLRVLKENPMLTSYPQLPLIGDLVVYSNLPKEVDDQSTLVVMSTHVIQPLALHGDPKYQFDVKFKSAGQEQQVVNWFENMWRALSEVEVATTTPVAADLKND